YSALDFSALSWVWLIGLPARRRKRSRGFRLRKWTKGSAKQDARPLPTSITFPVCRAKLLNPHSGHLRHRLLQQLHALGPLLPSNIDAYPGDVAAGPCEAGDNAELDWIAEDPDNRNRAGGRFKIEHHEGPKPIIRSGFRLTIWRT